MGITILIADKIAFKAKIVISVKKGYFIMIKVLIQQEKITFKNYLCLMKGSQNT